MKEKLLLLSFVLLLVISSCRKQKLSDTIYPQFVGVWRNVNGHYSPEVEFTPNGQIIMLFDGERGRTIKVDEIQEMESHFINNTLWNCVQMGNGKKGIFEGNRIIYYQKGILDTIMLSHQDNKFVRK